jgi:hypothetical protein
LTNVSASDGVDPLGPPICPPLLSNSTFYRYDPEPGSPPAIDGASVQAASTVGTEVENHALSVYPQPMAGRGTITLALSVAGAVEVSVYDTRGRLVQGVATSHLAAGEHQIPLDASELASGVYVVIADTADGRLTHTLVVR